MIQNIGEEKDFCPRVYIPFYTIENIDNIFILFTIKQLFQQIKSITYLQVAIRYKIT